MDDSARYRETLQRSLLTEGWEAAFDARRFGDWARRNEEQLRARAVAVFGEKASSYGTELAKSFERFAPTTQYDLPSTGSIFGPLIDAVRACAAAIGLKPIRDIELVTSTSISPTPFARPTTGVHELYIGLGTSAFCNYWAKGYTAVVTALAEAGPPFETVKSREDVRRRLAEDPRGLALATRFALYYAAMGSLVGFGEVEEPPSSYAYRSQLLRAMEVFVVAHEYAHFVAEERGLAFEGSDGSPDSKRLELFCDEIGLQLAREWGSKWENWLSFTGVAAIAVLGALDICQTCSEKLATHWNPGARNPVVATESHPPTLERMERIAHWTVTKTATDQRARVQGFIEEYVAIWGALREVALCAADLAAAAADSDSEPT
jgi:hypothetical protein